MNSCYRSVDWILSQWAHFTLHSFICVYACVFHVFKNSVCVLYYCNTVRWTWWDWSLILRTLSSFHEWIRTFLCSRQMWAAMDGETSQKCKVDSGVPQRTVRGPLLFLPFINDLPNQISPGTITRPACLLMTVWHTERLRSKATRGSSRVTWRH